MNVPKLLAVGVNIMGATLHLTVLDQAQGSTHHVRYSATCAFTPRKSTW
jgi:hypothetical protein